MARNGSGVYSLPAGYAATTGATATATQHNAPLEDIAADLNAARPISAGGTGATTAALARTALGLEIGADAQAYNAKLQSLSGLTGAADRLPYLSGTSTFALATFTSFARTLLDDADAATARTTLGVVKQTSATDTTAGRLMAVGAFGLGAGSVPTSTDWDALAATGFYTDGANAATGEPAAYSSMSMLSIHASASSGSQLAMRSASFSPEAYLRGRSDSAWGDWTELTTEANVGAHYGAITLDAIGSHLILTNNSGANLLQGNSTSGANLLPVVPGTWIPLASINNTEVTTFRRIA